MDRRTFFRGAGTLAGAAIPLAALVARAQEPLHRGGLRHGHTAGYGPLFPTHDQSTGLPLIARQVAVREPAEPRHHVRDHRAVEVRGTVALRGDLQSAPVQVLGSLC